MKKGVFYQEDDGSVWVNLEDAVWIGKSFCVVMVLQCISPGTSVLPNKRYNDFWY
ncbi:MAG: hypothetical protein IPO48_19960 [Saprospiraceae bacterium]|nr:hypothetical protein [Saprospiraceae bacterium]